MLMMEYIWLHTQLLKHVDQSALDFNISQHTKLCCFCDTKPNAKLLNLWRVRMATQLYIFCLPCGEKGGRSSMDLGEANTNMKSFFWKMSNKSLPLKVSFLHYLRWYLGKIFLCKTNYSLEENVLFSFFSSW